MNPDPVIAECRAVLEENSKSFALAARLLAPAQRDHAAVVYAWCRHVDDTVDEAPAGTHAAALASLEEELGRIASGERSGNIIEDAFMQVKNELRIPMLYAEELVAGMAMDVEGRRYETRDDLLLYCHRVAGVVGLLMCHVFGVREEAALVHAVHLGWGMQLTNICRDVAEDWSMGRLYLPADRLRAHGFVHEAQPAGPLPRHPAFAAVVQEMLNDADLLYRSGDLGLRSLPPRSALAVDVARRVYSAIGDRLVARGYSVYQGRAFVSTPRKLTHVAGALVARAVEAPSRAFSRVVSGEGFDAPRGSVTFETSLAAFPVV
ncbi:MAG: phytoene/squalene synthase family protein [Polyangiales bacterium]